jgi:hypothetical protein
VSGNGFVVLLGGGLAMLARRETRRRVIGLLLPVGAVVLIAMWTPAGRILRSRVTEVGVAGSSGSLRMIEPYQALLPEMTSNLPQLVLGQGASSADTFMKSLVVIDQGMVSPAVPKLLYEYGLVAGLTFLVFLGFTVFWRPVAMPLSAGLGLAFFVVNASLLQPTIALATLLFSTVLRPAVTGAPHGAWPLSPRGVRGAVPPPLSGRAQPPPSH